ncbi:formylglycine-generating enzyme family protein [Myxococcota bacterium]|nr:formylglycine-generating enzyme family protein [Myxococcota bacterium]
MITRTPQGARLGALLLTSLWALSGCVSEGPHLDDRLCATNADCPGRRVCLDGACVLPNAEPVTLCRGDVLTELEVRCEDYVCATPALEVLSGVDCSTPRAPTCAGETLISYRAGACDPEGERCVYPEAGRVDCSANLNTCEGDLLKVKMGNGCVAEEGRCDFNQEEINCRQQALVASCDPTEDAPELLRVPVLEEGVIACDPRIRDCVVPDAAYIDCAATQTRCEGAVAVTLRGGACAQGACDYSAGERLEIDCARAPAPRCEGSVLITAQAGGCDKARGCLYTEINAVDCAAPRFSCDGARSVQQEGGLCDAQAGRCVYPEPIIEDCALAPPSICQEGRPEIMLSFAGGGCDQGSGRCVYPPAVVTDCSLDRDTCVGDRHRRQQAGSCVEGQCSYTTVEEIDCALTPASRCDGEVAINYLGPGVCDPATGVCDYGDNLEASACYTEPFCQSNVYFRPPLDICRVRDDVAGCHYISDEDDNCNRPSSPHCVGDVQISYKGPGVCDAAGGCNNEDVRVETQCARCLSSANAECILPGFIHIPAPGHTQLGAEGVGVEITGDYVMAATELTRGQLGALIEEMGLDEGLLGEVELGCDDASCPVTGLSFYDAVKIANAWSAREGLAPCYDPLGNVIGGEGGDPHLCAGYRLPTEVEWEFAYRARTSSPWYCGDNPACVNGIAWTEANAGGRPHPVATKAPNLWRLYDMAGNAPEWAHDYHTEAPLGGPSFYGPGRGEARVIKGGAWTGALEDTWATARAAAAPSERVAGLRLVRGLTPRVPAYCDYEADLDESVKIRPTARSRCALTSGVPCLDFETAERCPEGCITGVCRPTAPFTIDIPTAVPLSRPWRFLVIPAGAFAQGNLEALSNSENWTNTTQLTHDFWLAETELTQGQLYALLPDFTHFRCDASDDDLGCWAQEIADQINQDALRCGEQGVGCPNSPVLMLSFNKAIEIANELSARMGLAPCYDATGRVIGGATPYLCEGYRLPTDAEWEYAYRAGTQGRFYCDEEGCIDDIAWHHDNAAKAIPFPPQPEDCPCVQAICPFRADNGRSCLLPREVATRAPNAWGLYDMAGNVAEWVSDWSPRDAPPIAAPLDPYRDNASGSDNVVRGNSVFHPPESHHAAARRTYAFYEDNDDEDNDDASLAQLSTHGLRLARTIFKPQPAMIPIDPPAEGGAFTLTRGFEISRTEVTQAEYAALLFDTPSGFWLVGGLGECPNCPVEQVTWLDAVRYANALSQRQGLEPCYAPDGVVRNDAGDPYLCEGYRLPTEAEWQVAYFGQDRAGQDQGWHCIGAEGGCDAQTPCVEDEDQLEEIAWYLCSSWYRAVGGQSCARFHAYRDSVRTLCEEPWPDGGDPPCFTTNEVARKAPNCQGLYDMAGNVREWVHDVYDPQRPPTGDDPWGPQASEVPPCLEGEDVPCRGVRGGGWSSRPTEARGDLRGGVLPTTQSPDLGFRVARTRHEGGGAP